MCQLHEAILKDLLLMQFFLYVLTQIKIFIFGHLPAIGMANNFIQSAVAIAYAHVVSEHHYRHGFYQWLTRWACIFASS